MNIAVLCLAAALDPRLLGAVMKWRPFQLMLFKAVDDGPRVLAVPAGRRVGKSRWAAAVMVIFALLRPDLDAKMAPGETRYVLAIATRLDQAALLISYCAELINASPLLKGMLVSASQDELRFELPGGRLVCIKAMPSSARGIRGWTVSLLVADEVAHFMDTEGNSSAEAVLNAILPSLATFGDAARVLLISTPSGDRGAFRDYCSNGTSGAWPWVQTHHVTSAEGNPDLSEEYLEQERLRDPDAFRSEYLAEFVSGGTSFIDVDRLLVEDRGELAPDACDEWLCGLDPAFVRDAFGVVLIGRNHAEPDRLRLGLALGLTSESGSTFEDRRLGEDERLAAVAAILRDYQPTVTLADQYAGGPVRERLSRLGIEVTPYNLSQETKAAAFQELRQRLYTGELELYSHPGLLSELRRLGLKYTPRGPSVITPRQGLSHCDIAIAAALAAQAARAEVEAFGVRGDSFAIEHDLSGWGQW